MCVSKCGYGYMSAHGHGGQKRTEDPTELELQVVVSFLTWVPGTESGRWKSNKPSLSLSGPTSCFL